MNHYRLIQPCSILALACVLQSCGWRSEGLTADVGQHHHESMTVWTDAVEVYVKHPELVAGEAAEPWAVHLTDLQTFEPVADDGTLSLQFTATDGRQFSEPVGEQVATGIYAPQPSFADPGTYDLVVRYEGPQLTAEVVMGTLHVHDPADDVAHAEDEVPTGITLLKEQQWSVGLATETAVTRRVPRSVDASGEIAPEAGRLVEVTAPVDGLVLPQDNSTAPVEGEWVRQGDTLAVLAPVAGDAAFALQVAREQQLALDAARAERLFAVEAISARRLEDARRDLEVARAALTAMGAAPQSGYDFALCAPISGVIDRRDLVAGRRVNAGQPVYTIVDPRSVWLLLNVAAHHAQDLSRVSGASFTVEGSDRVYETHQVVSIGTVIERATRTFPVIFELDNPDQSLRVGMLAEGLVLLGEPESGVAIPAAAVRREDGVFAAYVQIGGELFERRLLDLGPSDNTWTIVRSGIREGERVVTTGAYQVKLATLNTTELTDHGHAH